MLGCPQGMQFKNIGSTWKILLMVYEFNVVLKHNIEYYFPETQVSNFIQFI
jgi:hypothetical protein